MIEPTLLNHLKHHKDKVNNFAFSRDGALLANASDDCTVSIYDVQSKKIRHTLRHSDLVMDISFSPEGDRLASTSCNETVVIWDVKTGKLIKKLTHHTSDVYAVEFSPDGRLLGSGSHGNQTGDVVCEMKHHKGLISSLSFSPDSSMVASASWDRTVCISKTDTGKLLKRISHNGPVFSGDFTSDGKIL